MVYINNQYCFLFVENPKCASTTIIYAFNKIFQIGIVRGGPNNCHLTCDEIKSMYPYEWENYIKITTYRDPFDRFCSSINYAPHQNRCFDYEKHLKNDTCVYCLPQEEFIKGCDIILHVDNLQHDFDLLCKRLQIKTISLDIFNKSKDKYYNNEEIIKAYNIFVEHFKN